MHEGELGRTDLDGGSDQCLGGGGQTPEIREGEKDGLARDQCDPRHDGSEIAKMEWQKVVERVRVILPRIECEGVRDQIAKRKDRSGVALLLYGTPGEQDQARNEQESCGESDQVLETEVLEGHETGDVECGTSGRGGGWVVHPLRDGARISAIAGF